ncbi:MAG: SAF domain-containing protein, partial [Candidatus Uhrbacteria bacterium]|nr:SAF domain-containing protein [Candidatus Uhrbacteria bacterium]
MLKLLFSPKIQLLISLVLAIAAFVVFGYWAISLADASEQVTVVAAAKDLSAPAILTAEDLKLIRIRRDSVPKNAVADLPKAVGLTLTHTVSLNQILTLNELVAKLNPDLAGLTVPGDLKGFTLTNAWLASPLPKIKKDDTLMIIISTPGRDGNRNTGILAQRVPVLATVSASDGSVQQV